MARLRLLDRSFKYSALVFGLFATFVIAHVLQVASGAHLPLMFVATIVPLLAYLACFKPVCPSCGIRLHGISGKLAPATLYAASCPHCGVAFRGRK